MSPRNVSGKDFIIISQSEVHLNAKITNSKPGMLLIYADWCPHCHTFLPTFNEIHKAIGHSFTIVGLENADLEKYPKVSKALDFQSFPTIKFFDQNGKIISHYKGSRTKQEILDHICKIYHHCMKR